MTGPDETPPPRLVAGAAADEERQYDAGLRPRTMDEYIGQDRIRENLLVSIQAARQRGEALDHVLLYGPPGLGKTTLAHVIGNELGVPVRSTAGPVLEKPGDLAAILTSLKAREVYFIADMHRELWGDCAFTIIDLDGNRLTFAQAQRYPAHVDAATFEQIA